jgi:hypothetical protein
MVFCKFQNFRVTGKQTNNSKKIQPQKIEFFRGFLFGSLTKLI